jgi:hypothetical protein
MLTHFTADEEGPYWAPKIKEKKIHKWESDSKFRRPSSLYSFDDDDTKEDNENVESREFEIHEKIAEEGKNNNRDDDAVVSSSWQEINYEGGVYYYNTITGESSWVDPRSAAITTTPASATGSVASSAMVDREWEEVYGI